MWTVQDVRRRFGLVVLLAMLVLVPVAPSAQDPPQTPRQFRTSTTLIPVDVRVLDRTGKPVTDLTQADFTVVEDGRRQAIEFFSGHGLVAAEPGPNALPLLRDPRAASLGPQNHRVFLLVLGRGRLQPPAKGVDALLGFVKERLLPQDQVAILAWNRATDFTSDHARIVAVLERFKKEHEGIDSLLRQRFSGLAAVYGGSKIPEGVQARIDAVFAGPDAAGVRALPEAQAANSARVASDQRRTREILLGTPALDVIGAAEAETIDLTFDDFVEGAAQTNQDLGNLYTGVEYLRHLAGEKHMVFVTENGLQLPRMEDANGLAAVANDARVVIDTIHTGGLPPSGGATPPNASLQTSARGRPMQPPGFSLAQRQRVADLRAISTLTGGIASQFAYASRGVQRIADATSFQYLLAYYPTNVAWNGRYRNIRVIVNRPDVTVLYRRGYYGSQELPPLNRIEMLTLSRISGAANYDREVPDIKIDAKPVVEGQPPASVRVALTIAMDRLSLTEQAGRRIGKVKVTVFIGDRNERVIGESWQDLDLSLSEATYQRFLAEGIRHQVSIPVSGVPAYVKVIAYDFNADLVGSAIVKVR